LKVVHVLSSFFPDTTGGTEHYVLALTKGLSLLGIDSAIALPGLDDAHDRQAEGLRVFLFKDRLAEKVHQWGASIVHFHEFASGGKISVAHLKSIRALGIRVVVTPHVSGNSCFVGSMYKNDKLLCEGVMDRWKCTSCFHQVKRPGTTTGLLTLLSELCYRLGIEFKKENGKIASGLNNARQIELHHQEFRSIVELSSLVVGISAWYTDVLKRNFPNASNIRYIPTGKMHPVKPNRGNSDRSFLSIVFVGRITPIKGLHLLLEALSSFPQNTYALHVIGPTQSIDLSYVNQLIEKYADNKRIHWLNTLDANATMRRIADADLLCLPSLVAEMSPLVIDEAHAAGIPVVVSDVPGSREKILEGKNGFFFKRGDADDLKRVIDELMQMHKRGELHATELSSIAFEETVRQYHLMYTTVLNEDFTHS
jgi:glycosyltransferase involved in cell wall biosynthesis